MVSDGLGRNMNTPTHATITLDVWFNSSVPRCLNYDTEVKMLHKSWKSPWTQREMTPVKSLDESRRSMKRSQPLLVTSLTAVLREARGIECAFRGSNGTTQTGERAAAAASYPHSSVSLHSTSRLLSNGFLLVGQA